MTRFEDAIKIIPQLTMWNASQHADVLVAGLQDAATRIEELEKQVKTLTASNSKPIVDDVKK